MQPAPIASSDITLGILAGGRATRLGGVDKAWLLRGGVPQVLRWRRRFATEVATTLVSANRDLARYAASGLEAVTDRVAGGAGPLAGLDALLAGCTTLWLLSLPVDLVGVNECLLPTLAAEAGEAGTFAIDADGVQPLVALWNVPRTRVVVAAALEEGGGSVQRVQQALSMRGVRFAGVRFGNLNTVADLAAAGASVQ
ncbi:MAG: NTP transferase domain-containing protein [Lysobacter sp.]|nr:NTP transferase domain-containing protein [Lysobacter sp.]